MTAHLELIPQEFGHGSAHLLLMHAILVGHSELTVHSGLQNGGEPTNVGEHVQTACPFASRHWLFGPQGDGLHGCDGRTGSSSI